MTQIGRTSLAYRTLIFAGMLILGAFLYAAFDPVVTRVLDQAAIMGTTQVEQTGQTYTQQLWDWLPFAFLVLAMLYYIGGAVLESKLPGGR